MGMQGDTDDCARWLALLDALRPVNKDIAALDAFRFMGFRPFANLRDVVLRLAPGEPRIGLGLSQRLTRIPPTRALIELTRVALSLDALAPALAALHASVTLPSQLRLGFADDGGEAGLCFDRPLGSDRPLLPDLYMLRHLRAGRPVTRREPAAALADYLARRPVLFWRGATTGPWIASIDDLAANPRVAACLAARARLGARADCRVVQVIAKPAIRADAEAWLAERDLLGPRVPQQDFARSQMVLDLPGNAAAWGTYMRYLEGTLVLRVAHGRELIYYPVLRPWTHFVPVAADLHDLEERVSWALANPVEAARIAQAGHDLMAGLLDDLQAITLAALCGALVPD